MEPRNPEPELGLSACPPQRKNEHQQSLFRAPKFSSIAHTKYPI